ncbi:hypothetical protein Tco_0796249 [Tanacetum coccineum]
MGKMGGGGKLLLRPSAGCSCKKPSPYNDWGTKNNVDHTIYKGFRLIDPPRQRPKSYFPSEHCHKATIPWWLQMTLAGYQGLGHEWYFNLDNLTDSLGYTRFKSNQPAGPKVNIASAQWKSSDYAEELASFKDKHMRLYCRQSKHENTDTLVPIARREKRYWDKMDSLRIKRCQRSMIVKKIFKYLKGQPKLGLWYPRDSSFVLEAYSNSDYAGSNVIEIHTGGNAIPGRRLVSWQCKKQTVVPTSHRSTKMLLTLRIAHCCGQSTICIVKNPVFHQRTKHIEIRHHFIRDANEKNLIQLSMMRVNCGYAIADISSMNNQVTPTKRRFLQMILDIETRNTKPYHAFRLTSKMFANMRLNFHGDHMPLVAAMLPPTQAAIAAGTSGEAAPPNPQTDHETVTEPVHQTASPHDHGSTSPRPTPTTPAAQLNEPVSKPPRPIPTSPSAQVNQQGPSSDPHVESSSKDNDSNPDPNVADDPLGGSFFASPSRSTAAPPEGTTSGGAEDLLNLTALYTLVSEQGKKIESLESELQAHKLLFKDVMGKLVKRVKFLESKLKARGRNVILSESDKEEDEEQDVDSLIKLAMAAATAADTSSVPADATQATEFPPSSSIHTDSFVHGNDVPTGTASDFSADPSNKGKSPMVEEDPPIKERSFRQMEEDRLGAEAARKLYEEEQAELARVQEEMKKKRQEDVINSAKYYTDADWSDIMGQVHANQGLTADLLGPDVNEDNFTARMVALIAERRRQFVAQRFQDKRNKPLTYAQQRDYIRTFVKNQSSTIYSTGWTLKHVRSFSDAQLKAEFDKIRHALDNLQLQHLRRSLKRQGAYLDQPDSKKSKSTEPQKTSIPAASRPLSADVTPDKPKQPPVAPTPPSGFSATPTVTRTSGPRTRNQSSAADIKTYSTRRKSLG